jgi:hypothetical protein
MHCRDATAISFIAKARGEVFARFHVVAVKLTVVCRLDCLACQDEFFMNSLLNVKENNEHALDFVLDLSCLLWSALNRACHSNTCVWFMLFSSDACLIIARVSLSHFSEISQNLMHTHCQIHHKITSGQIHDSK